MIILQMYRTESDWCALVGQSPGLPGDGQRITLTYAEPPDEAQVLADAEAAFEARANGDVFFGVDETTTLGEKKALARGQVVSAAQLTGTEPVLDDITASLHDVAERLNDDD
jgi:hypothetical protein